MERYTESASPGGRRRWLVLYLKPRHEKKSLRLMLDGGIESLLPLREELHQWKDRKKHVDVPLFPGYLFVHVNERERIAALETAGALKYVHFGGAIAVVRQETIDALQLALTRRADVRVEETWLDAGAEVTVRHGPLAGLKGILLEHRGQTRVAVRIEAIRQSVSVEVAVADLL